ncbi:NAGK [Cordylochernes scorpioides]|uniref:NAGK n=1 Tax=Cordylochernes scorpioides TaxID=51811 RepID=A0ABY6KB67_9ARAC|nr:NAGK [Cordylochernes scorpioides]
MTPFLSLKMSLIKLAEPVTSVTGRQGASYMRVAILDERGKVLASVTGTGYNHLLMGKQKAQEGVVNLISQVKSQANLPQDTVFTSLGMAMSGCEDQKSNTQMEEEWRTHYSHISGSWTVCSDTVGSIYTASSSGISFFFFLISTQSYQGIELVENCSNSLELRLYRSQVRMKKEEGEQ